MHNRPTMTEFSASFHTAWQLLAASDARLFATEYPDMDVLTFGPGQLAFAHSDQEQIDLKEIRAAAEFLALFILQQTGTVKLG